MRKIVEYQLIAEGHAGQVSSKANELIAAGWQPFGSPAPLVLGQDKELDSWLVQAMVKYAEDEQMEE